MQTCNTLVGFQSLGKSEACLQHIFAHCSVAAATRHAPCNQMLKHLHHSRLAVTCSAQASMLEGQA